MERRNVIIFVLSFIILAITGIIYISMKGANAPFVVPNPQPQPPPAPNPTPTPSAQIPSDWKTYRNEDIGVSLAYPKDWFLYDNATWEKDNQKEKCEQFSSLSKDEFILSKKNLGTCVGYALFENRVGDFILNVTPDNCPNFPYVLGVEGAQLTMLNNTQAVRYPFTIKSALPRKLASRIYGEYNNRCYLVEFNQTDNEGHYDPIFDKILATIKFLR